MMPGSFAYPKNDSILGTLLQLNLYRWEKALCPKIGNNEEWINEFLPLDYGIHACDQGPSFLTFLKLE